MSTTRDHILQTAFKLFLSKSYKAVTMLDLEKATGLTKGAFYHYFKNKKEIYIEVVDKYFLANHTPKDSNILETGTLNDFIDLHVEHIKYLSTRLKEITCQDGFDPTSISLIIEAKEYYPGFTEKLKESNNKIFDNWERVISRSKLKSEIQQTIESDILAENFIAIGHSIFRYMLSNRSLEYAISMVKLQYAQLYRLVKS